MDTVRTFETSVDYRLHAVTSCKVAPFTINAAENSMAQKTRYSFELQYLACSWPLLHNPFS
jgi:hypothetical protein